MIEVIINLLALAAGVSLGIMWERRHWIGELNKLADHLSRSAKGKD